MTALNWREREIRRERAHIAVIEKARAYLLNRLENPNDPATVNMVEERETLAGWVTSAEERIVGLRRSLAIEGEERERHGDASE